MNLREVKKLGVGIYKVFWRVGGQSLAAIGVTVSGDKWIAPTNWVYPTDNQKIWRSVLRVEEIYIMLDSKCYEVHAHFDMC